MNNANDFNVDSADTAYDIGRDAYYCTHMVSVTDNPYASGTVQHASWLKGFEDAHSDDAE